MILLIDNYDSFTYNAAHGLAMLGGDVQVRRNDRMTVKEAEELEPDYLVISPGPGGPRDAGVSMDLIATFAGSIPILGICLGHQCIGEVFDGRVGPASSLVHGKTSRIYHDGAGLFAGLKSPFEAGRYHSLAVEESSLPACLQITAQTAEGEIMGIRHRTLPVEGVQFHPESILTPQGQGIFRNFLGMGRAPLRQAGRVSAGGEEAGAGSRLSPAGRAACGEERRLPCCAE